jgi:hypothetical protein
MASDASHALGETGACDGETRALECSSQRPNLHRAQLKGGEIAVQVRYGFDAAEIVF